jgi:CBS domain-containing protein
MAYRDRTYGVRRGEQDFDDSRNRTSGRRVDRGYSDDERSYGQGYNVNRESDYRSEVDARYADWNTRNDDVYRRNYPPSNRRAISETDRRDRDMARGFYNQGPQRSHLRCRDIMTRTVATCRRDTPIAEVARLMRDDDVGALPVIGPDGKLEGIITDRDIVVTGLNSDKPEAELRAEDCMSTDLYTANQNDRVVEVIDEMGDHKVRRIPVVDSRERLVGIISMADIALETNKDMELAHALKNVSQPPSWLGRLANLFHW